jgi:hypothetical protein
MILAMIGSSILMVGIFGLCLYLMARSDGRRFREQVDRKIAEMQKSLDETPPLEPYVREPLPDEDPPDADLHITFRRRPGADGALPAVAARLIDEAGRLERSFGGEGLEYDPAGSVEEPTRLVLRLVPNRVDWETPDRLGAVADELNHRLRKAREATPRQNDDILSQIDRELNPPLPPDVIRGVEVAVGLVTPDPPAAVPA